MQLAPTSSTHSLNEKLSVIFSSTLSCKADTEKDLARIQTGAQLNYFKNYYTEATTGGVL